jgi:hypothetical protein
MIRSILVLSLICLNVISYGQRDIYKVTSWSFWQNTGIDRQAKALFKEKNELKENQVKSREIIHYTNGKRIKTTQFFNVKGLVTKIIRDYQKKVNTIDYSYDKEDNIIEILSTNSKNEIWKTHYDYNSDNKLIGRDTYDDKGNYSGSKSGYNSEGKMVFQEIYKKSKTVPTHSLTYSYYEGGSKKSTTYKVKGNVKYVWNYDCKSEGELINIKNKHKSTICIKEEINKDGNRVVWERTFNDKGGLTKIQKVYSSDSTIISRKVFNTNDRLVSETSYSKHNKGGKQFLGSYSAYYGNKGGIERTAEHLANENGQLIKSDVTGKWPHTYLYHYENDLKTTEVRVYKKSTIVDEFIYSFY